MGRNLIEGDSHRLALIEAVPFTEAVDHARADVPANSGLDDLVLRLAQLSYLSPDGVEHLVVEPYGRSDLGHLTSVAASGALGSPSPTTRAHEAHLPRHVRAMPTRKGHEKGLSPATTRLRPASF
ncbi:MAG: hypothetical protein M3P85_08760 [Actinomycetota bacterium]|nr:hypothetical protein [Actinomycetota bacterium]